MLFTALSLRRESKSRCLWNLLALKQEHRELWNAIHSRPDFARVLQDDVDLVAAPITNDEEIFLRQVIVHAATAWELVRDGTPLSLEAFRADVAQFFSLPLPCFAW